MLTIILIHVQRGRAYGIRPRFYLFSSMLSAWKESHRRESDSWPLPYQGSALPLSYCGLFYSLSLLSTFFFRSGAGVLLRPAFSERKTGLEPATYSLEGYRSTKWATSASLVLVFRGGGWTRTTELFRGQIYSLLQLPLCDSPDLMNPEGFLKNPSRWRDSNPRQADYKSATLPTELHRRFQPFKQLFSHHLRLQKYYFFHIPPRFFFIFLHLFYHHIDFQ